MAKSYPGQLGPGAFVPTTTVLDPAEIYTTDLESRQFKELIVRLYQTVNNLSLAVNLKDSGYYVDQEFVTGQQYFPNPALSSTTSQTPTYRQTFRKVVNFGALPNTATKQVAHGITFGNGFSATRIYGAATDPTTPLWAPIPYSSPTLANNIELYIDGTNVKVITGSNRTNFSTCYIIIEYIKQ